MSENVLMLIRNDIKKSNQIKLLRPSIRLLNVYMQQIAHGSRILNHLQVLTPLYKKLFFDVWHMKILTPL